MSRSTRTASRVRRHAWGVGLLAAALTAAACSDPEPIVLDDPPPTPNAGDTIETAPPPTATEVAPATDAVVDDGTFTVVVDVTQPGERISPLIRGVSEFGDTSYFGDLGITLNSWGGDAASRYNYTTGTGWNAGREGEFRNANPRTGGNDAEQFVRATTDAGALVRLTVPTIGWVAKNGDPDVCSFPDGRGGCSDVAGANCDAGGPIGVPTATSVESTPAAVAEWVDAIQRRGDVAMIAMDNEPELWGYSHFDVHPTCTTYQEIVDTYLAYADALRPVAPRALFMGPVMCCWFDFWRTAPGPDADDQTPFLEWFLDQVRRHDEATGVRSLDVLDVHYFPQGEVYNDLVDDYTAAKRIRATESLFDSGYVDESWIGEEIALVPRLRAIADLAYPGTRVAISEWNFGGEQHMSGAIAIAETLGIFGREGVFAASYWKAPPPGSPAALAFKMFGNFDDEGSQFGGVSVPATSEDADFVGSYAALDEQSGNLRVLLTNKSPELVQTVRVELTGYTSTDTVLRYVLRADDPTRIGQAGTTTDGDAVLVELPPYSITLLDLAPQGP